MTDTLQAEAFKRLYPEQYYARFIESDIRPDGRSLGNCRATTIGLGAFSSAAGSALVKIGSTTVIAGLRLEVMVPDSAAPAAGQLAIDVQMTPLASGDYRPGATSEITSRLTQMLHDVLIRGKVVDLQELCISPEQAVWVLYLDLYITDADGCLLDAALLAAFAALCDLNMPPVRVTEAGNVERTDVGDVAADEAADRADGGGGSSKLTLGCMPVCLTCGLYQGSLVVDPTSEEEKLMAALVTVVANEHKQLMGLYKAGGSALAMPDVLQQCMRAAHTRHAEVVALLQQALGQE